MYIYRCLCYHINLIILYTYKRNYVIMTLRIVFYMYKLIVNIYDKYARVHNAHGSHYLKSYNTINRSQLGRHDVHLVQL